jgi:hypothetical protein
MTQSGNSWALPGQRVGAALTGDHRGDAAPAHSRRNSARSTPVLVSSEKIDSIVSTRSGSPIDRRIVQPDEQRLEIVFTRLDLDRSMRTCRSPELSLPGQWRRRRRRTFGVICSRC